GPLITHQCPLSLHDALPISSRGSKETTWCSSQPSGCSGSRRTTTEPFEHTTNPCLRSRACTTLRAPGRARPVEITRWCPSSASRSEEHTSELQSRFDLVCRL